MPSSFAEEIEAKLRELDNGDPQFVEDQVDDSAFGNAWAIFKQEGLSLRFVNDRGLVNLDIGIRNGQGVTFCPLEVLAVALDKEDQDKLLRFYGILDSHSLRDAQSDAYPPLRSFFNLDDALNFLGKNFQELVAASVDGETKGKVDRVQAIIQDRLAGLLFESQRKQ